MSALREVIDVTPTQATKPDDAIEQVAAPVIDRTPRSRWLIGAVAVIVASMLGFGAGWLAFSDDGEAGDAPPESGDPVPAGLHDVVDQFLVAFETNDYELLQDVVTERFRRPFYQGDPDGSPWRDDYRIEAYEFMDDPNLSDTELAFYDIETVGERIVRGTGPWYVSEAQNWTEANRPNRYEAVHTMVVVDVDGTLLVDDAYWAGTSVLVAEE